MKTSLEIDDEIYREAEVYATQTGRKVTDLLIEGLRLALERADRSVAFGKLSSCFAEADEAAKAVPCGSIARSHLEEDRGRI